MKEQDQQRLKAMNDEKQQNSVLPATMETVQAAKALSETKLNNGSALDAIAGAGAFPGA